MKLDCCSKTPGNYENEINEKSLTASSTQLDKKKSISSPPNVVEDTGVNGKMIKWPPYFHLPDNLTISFCCVELNSTKKLLLYVL